MFQTLLELFICLIIFPLKQRSCLTPSAYLIQFMEPKGRSVNVCGMNKYPHALSIPFSSHDAQRDVNPGMKTPDGAQSGVEGRR